MKVKILLTVLMVTMISLTVTSKAGAHPWHYRSGWHRPHAAILIPPIPVPVPAPRVVVNPGYCGPRYYGPRYGGYYNNGYYGDRYYGRHYDHDRYRGRERGYDRDDRGYRHRNEHYGPRQSQHYRR